MKGLVKYQIGDGFMEVREVPEPKPGPGQVKIAVALAGICGSDLHIYHSDIAIPVRAPVVTGHEFSGTIAEVGEGVTEWKPGDRVVSETAFSFCGTCMHCREGFYNLCNERRTLGYWYNGVFAPFTVVPAGRLHALPDNLSFREGALMEPLACVTHALLELTLIRPGDAVVITGPGAVGLAALQVARACGARVMVAGSAVDKTRLEMARNFGACEIVDISKEDLVDKAMAWTNGSGADILLECSGNRRALESALLSVRKRGQLTQVGLFGQPVMVDFERICFKEIQVTGSLGSTRNSWEKALRLSRDGQVSLEPLISDVYPLDSWKQAFEAFEQKKGLKLMLNPNEQD